MHILICDDDAATRFVAKRLLTRDAGCTVAECANGAEALRLVNRGGVDLLLLDIGMPVVDGVEVLSAIRSSQQFAELPVIMLSRESRADIVARLVRLGVSGYLLKPLDAERLKAALDKVA